MLMLVAFILGGCFGVLLVILVALMMIAGESDKRAEQMQKDCIEYKCKINMDSGCGDLCCKFCPAASDCRWGPCQGNPAECEQAIIRMK